MATNNPAPQPEAVRVMKQLLNQNNLEIEFRYLHPVTVQASVRNTELKMPRDSGILSSVWAAGKSREDSLRNLAQVISGGRLVYHATGGPLRREIDVPNLPQDPDRPPPLNEIRLVLPEDGQQGEQEQTQRPCHLCRNSLIPTEPRWELKGSKYRICQACIQGHRLFIGEPLAS